MKSFIFLICSSLICISVLSGCGSSEAIAYYNYNTPKRDLEIAVNKVLNSKSNIIWDSADLTAKRYREALKKETWYVDKIDTIKTYKYRGTFFWITIKEDTVINNYGVRYLGDEANWNSAPNSSIFITEIWNNQGLDLRQGENVSEFSSNASNKAKRLFDKEFISKLDAELKLKSSKD